MVFSCAGHASFTRPCQQRHVLQLAARAAASVVVAALHLAHVADELGGHLQARNHLHERRLQPTITAPRRYRPRPRATCAPGTAPAARPCTCASQSNKMKPTGGFKSKRVEAGQGGTCERFARRTWGRGCPALHKAAGVIYATHLNCNTTPTVGEVAPGSTSCTRPCRYSYAARVRTPEKKLTTWTHAQKKKTDTGTDTDSPALLKPRVASGGTMRTLLRGRMASSCASACPQGASHGAQQAASGNSQ